VELVEDLVLELVVNVQEVVVVALVQQEEMVVVLRQMNGDVEV
jgi:hypothetical protein